MVKTESKIFVPAIPKQLKEDIGACFILAMDTDAETKIPSTRRLLTLIKAASKFDKAHTYDVMIQNAINDVGIAGAEFVQSEKGWGHAIWLCEKVLDDIAFLVYNGYGEIKPGSYNLSSTLAKEGKL